MFTIPAATRANLRTVANYLPGNEWVAVVANDLLRVIDDPAPLRPSGTMRAWMEAHHGDHVTTVQVDLRNPDAAAWTPPHRAVDATAASSVELQGSCRYYRGMRVLHAAPDHLIVTDNDWHSILYVVDRVSPDHVQPVPATATA